MLSFTCENAPEHTWSPGPTCPGQSKLTQAGQSPGGCQKSSGQDGTPLFCPGSHLASSCRPSRGLSRAALPSQPTSAPLRSQAPLCACSVHPTPVDNSVADACQRHPPQPAQSRRWLSSQLPQDHSHSWQDHRHTDLPGPWGSSPRHVASPSRQPPHVAENSHSSQPPPCPAPSLSQKAPGVSISAGNLSFSRGAGGPAAYPRRGALRPLRLVQAERGCPGCPAVAASLKEEEAMGGGGRG